MDSINRREENIGFSVGYMDRSKDPFEDFYSYSCGNWMKTHPIPPEKSRFGSFTQLEERNLEVLRKIVERCDRGEIEDKQVGRMVGDLYHSFMDTETIEKLRFSPINGLMEEVDKIKDFNDINQWIKDKGPAGMIPFFGYGSAEDKKESRVYSFYMGQGGLSLPDRDYYLSSKHSKILKDLKIHIKKMFSLYGLDEKTADAYSASIIKIETYLAKASRSQVELRDEIKNYNRFKLSEFQKRLKNLDILGFYSNLGAKEVPFIVVGQPEFFDALDRLGKIAEIYEIRAYMKWNILAQSAGVLHAEAEEENFDFFGRKLFGQKKQEPRWKRGIGVIDGAIGEALGQLYVRENFSEEAKSTAEEMINDIKDVFRGRLKKLEWMSPKTKKAALKKFHMLNVKVGYPEKFRDYSSIKIIREDIFGNIIRSAKFEVKREMSRVGKKVDKKEWLMTPSEVNAYYNPSQNELVFPAGILQPPFFDDKMDAAVNYGGIGGVIAHEITHGYDDQGRLYNGLGQLKAWWSKEDEREFKKRAKKVSKFYSSLEILPGVRVNGDLTLGENLADLGAVGIAYEALKRHITRHKDQDRKIEGFTQTQRFFIAWAQVWKENATPEASKLHAMVDPHSPGKVRGLIPAVTHPEFQDTIKSLSKHDRLPVKYPNLNMW